MTYWFPAALLAIIEVLYFGYRELYVYISVSVSRVISQRYNPIKTDRASVNGAIQSELNSECVRI